ncbi:MAG: TlpA disulfide reductase family protein [Anditalea sp.]
MNNKEVLKDNPPENKFWAFLRSYGFSTLMGIAVVIMFVSPDAKSFVLRQLMHTGLFNASIEKEHSDTSNLAAVDFAFEDGSGNVWNTSSLRDKVVFINFWASWCPPCRAEFPSIEALYSDYKNNSDMFFLMINEDTDIAAAYKYLERENYTVPFYRAKGNVPDEIYAGILPTTIVLDKEGKIRLHNTGFANYGSEKFMIQIEGLLQE